MIKVLYLPLNVGGNKQEPMYNAFREMENVSLEIFDYYGLYEETKNANLVNQKLLDVAVAFQPDLVHMQLQMTRVIKLDTLRKLRRAMHQKIIITNWSGDVRDKIQQEMLELASGVDYTLISNTGQLQLYKNAGCLNVKYWQIGYDDTVFYPQFKTNFVSDLVVAANAYPNSTFRGASSRVNIITKLKSKLGDKFQVYGGGYTGNISSGGCHGSDLNNAYNNSRCILNMSNYNDIDDYFSDRLLTCLGTGRPVISFTYPKYQNYFSDNQDILMASSFDVILDKLKLCKTDQDFANSVGINGYYKARSEHTYKSRVIELFNMLGLS